MRKLILLAVISIISLESALAQMSAPPLARAGARESRQLTIRILKNQAAREKLFKKERKKHRISNRRQPEYLEIESAKFRQALLVSDDRFTNFEAAQAFCDENKSRLATKEDMQKFVLLKCMFSSPTPRYFTSEQECKDRIKTYDIWSKSESGTDLLEVSLDGSEMIEKTWLSEYQETMKIYDNDPAYSKLTRDPQNFGKQANCVRELNEHEIYYINRDL